MLSICCWTGRLMQLAHRRLTLQLIQVNLLPPSCIHLTTSRYTHSADVMITHYSSEKTFPVTMKNYYSYVQPLNYCDCNWWLNIGIVIFHSV